MPGDSKYLNTIWKRLHPYLDRTVKLSLGLLLVVLLGLMFPRGESVELDIKVGAIWVEKDLIAPFSFPIYRDEAEYQKEVDQVTAKVYPVFERDPQIFETQLAKVETFFSQVQQALKLYRQHKRSAHENRPSAARDSSAFAQAANRVELPLSVKEWDILERLDASHRLDDFKSDITSLLQGYYKAGIIDRPKAGIRTTEIALRKGRAEDIIPISRVFDRDEMVQLLEKELRAKIGDDDVAELGYKIGVLYEMPNLRFNRAATDQAIEAAVQSVPRSIGYVQENERIVSKHERVTTETRLKLDSLRRARLDRSSEANRTAQVVGTVLHVGIVVMLFGIYLYLFRKRIWGNNRRLALITLVILLEGVFAYLTREANVNVPVEYLIFVPAASMLLTIIFDSRVGFYGTVIIAFLVAGIRGNDYSVALASLVAGALSVYTVRDMKNRTQIFRSLGFIFLGYSLTIVALALQRFESFNVVLQQLLLVLVNAIVSPVLTYGLLIFFERFFKVTTDLTLIELSHFNHPLLRLLAEKAPGTYHHSMTMASLAEAAAAAVGANEVLARVGAYFHDVGKIVKPTYFVENQKGSRNRHDKLAPRMSSLIISAHVKEGIALAREHGLPEEIIEFIPMHHGTTRIEYFYNKAMQLASSSSDETKLDEIKEQDYRYPGPKPQTKETGILMLADAIEATARTIEDPSPQRLEGLIDEIIRKRFEEGELDECPLTLKDLTNIKRAFLGVLIGIHHTRVKYPGDDGKPASGTKPERVDAAAAPGRLTRTITEIDRQ
jgi:putative nucleotidyltransferase with HDIG domain